MKLMLAEQFLPTFGVKGKAAASWLSAQGMALPEQPNSWAALPNVGRILRLGRAEFLVEGAAAAALHASWKDGLPNLYQVPRYDAGFVLSGDGSTAVLAEICSLDTRPEVVGWSALMTLVAGISATLVCEARAETTLYRLWCDGTYADYLREMLTEVVLEKGGAVAGSDCMTAVQINSQLEGATS